MGTAHWAVNCKKLESCPICDKLCAVTMNFAEGELCGSDDDQQRHRLARCSASFEIMTSAQRLVCTACDAQTTVHLTQRLMNKEAAAEETMLRCFAHCRPFICCLCGSELVKVI